MKLLIIEADEALRLGSLEILTMNGIDADTACCVQKANNLIVAGKNYRIAICTENTNELKDIPVVFLKKPYTAHDLLKAAEKEI